MKILRLLCFLGLLVSTPWLGRAALSRQNNILGKFVVVSVNGAATCVSDGRILELKKGDTIVARGSSVDTPAGANVVLVFSNGTGVYVDEKTQLKIEKFDQEFFAPNNNLRVEPSNSATVVKLSTGRVVVSTPRLLSGTTMAYQTPHAAVLIRGDKILIEATEKQTHVAMIAGNATVNPRDASGNFVSIGKRLVTGQEAFVKYTVGGSSEDESASAPPASDDPSAGAASPTVASDDPAAPLPTTVTIAPVAPAAIVLKLSGSAHSRLPDTTEDTALIEGSTLPAGSIISTGDASTLHLQPFAGAISTVLPNSVVQIERLVAGSDDAPKSAATLALKMGSLVSIIDPAGSSANEYLVRTLQGTARAQGTAFATSLDHGGFSLAATADTVSFTTSTGTTYQVAAGTVVVTGPGRDPQPPIALAQAVASNPAFSGVIQSAFATVADIVEHDVGALPPGSSVNLFSKVAASVTLALPDQAEQFATQAVTSIAAPGSTLNAHAAPAIAAVLQAMISATPDCAAALAAAAAQAAPEHAVAIAAAAAKGSPAQATAITAALVRGVIRSDANGDLPPASLQSVAALAAAVATSTPNQAGAIAASAMQSLLESAPATTPDVNARRGALIASAVTRAAPNQAVAIASAMMKTLTQELAEATPQILAQTAALLAGSIIAVVPPQAQPVATAVMQFLVEAYPNASDEWMGEIAGVLAATLAQLLPDSAMEIYAGIAEALGRSIDYVLALASQYLDWGSQLALEAAAITQSAALAFQQGNAGADALAAGLQLARAPAFAGPGRGLGFPPGFANNAGGRDFNSATSIIITQFNPEAVSQLTSDLEAAQAAQTSVHFYTEPTPDGGTTVRPSPTIPRTLPVETTVSPARLGV